MFRDSSENWKKNETFPVASVLPLPFTFPDSTISFTRSVRRKLYQFPLVIFTFFGLYSFLILTALLWLTTDRSPQASVFSVYDRLRFVVLRFKLNASGYLGGQLAKKMTPDVFATLFVHFTNFSLTPVCNAARWFIDRERTVLFCHQTVTRNVFPPLETVTGFASSRSQHSQWSFHKTLLAAPQLT